MTRPTVLAVYPGTFDPITLGHEDIIARTAKMFDQVIVAVAAGHHKKTMFSLEERMELARQSTSSYGNVRVESFSGLVRDFVVAHNAQVMVRGVRGTTDFDYEMQLAGMNRHLMPDVETIFLPPNKTLQFISSSFVREIASLQGEIDELVSSHVKAKIMEKV